MKKETGHTVKAGVKIGAHAGGLVFLVFGLVPAFYLSSIGTLAALSALAGGPVAPGLMVRALLVVGTIIGICAACALTVASGAAVGSVLGYTAEALTPTHADNAKHSES